MMKSESPFFLDFIIHRSSFILLRFGQPLRQVVEHDANVGFLPRRSDREHLEKLASVGPGRRAGHLFPVDVPAGASGSAKLVKLAVEGLPVRSRRGRTHRRAVWPVEPIVGMYVESCEPLRWFLHRGG